MTHSAIQKRKISQAIILIVTGTSLGIAYVVFSDGFENFYPFINGALTGFLVALVVVILEETIFSRESRKWPFIILLSLRTVLYALFVVLIIVSVTGVSSSIRNDESPLTFLESQEFRNYIVYGDFTIAVIYTLALSFGINFISLLSRKLGPGTLRDFVTGKYFYPVEERRIILFMSLADSEKILKDIGPFNFYKYLNDIFFLITDPITNNKGKIYEYVDDLIVVSWSETKANLNNVDSGCINAFFDSKNTVHSKKEYFIEKYGVNPELRGSLHSGPLLRSEVGDIKTEIVFHGDTMNTTARILEKCNIGNYDLLISKQTYDSMILAEKIGIFTVGTMNLKGKENPIELINLKEE